MKAALAAVLFALLPAFARTGEVKVPASSPQFRYTGQWTADHRCAWTGSSVTFRTAASHLTVELGGSKSPWALLVDGTEHAVLTPEPGRAGFVVSDLPAGEKTLTLVRRGEALFGVDTFGGITADAPLLAPPPAPGRRLLVIGDSISAGYGNEAPSVQTPFSAVTEDGYSTYWALAARTFGAEAECAAWSGRGLWRNRDKNARPGVDTMPVLARRILPADPASPPARRPPPDVCVITLGTNDIALGPLDGPAFRAAGQGLIEEIRELAPDGWIALGVAPMLGGDAREAVIAEFTALARANPRVAVVDLGRYGSPADTGSQHHPSEAMHRKMAVPLEAFLEQSVGWARVTALPSSPAVPANPEAR